MRAWGPPCGGVLMRDGCILSAGVLDAGGHTEAGTDPGSPARLELSEAFEQVGALEDAVRVLESVKATRPKGEAGEDLEMRLAWLYSEVEEEEKALDAWRDLWLRIEALSRRRYVEDRLMTVASRLGNLADLAIELEEAVLHHPVGGELSRAQETSSKHVVSNGADKHTYHKSHRTTSTIIP